MSKKPEVVSFKLFPGRDDDLIRFLKSIGYREKSSYIRLAIRNQFITKVCFSGVSLPTKDQMIPPLVEHRVTDSPEMVTLSDDELEARLDHW